MKNPIKFLRNRKGFTLIELVVVVAILGILSSIAIPRVGNVTQRAKEVADKANVRILQEAVERYIAESGDDDLNELEDELDVTLDDGDTKNNAEKIIDALISGVGDFGPYIKGGFNNDPIQEDKDYYFNSDTLEFSVK